MDWEKDTDLLKTGCLTGLLPLVDSGVEGTHSLLLLSFFCFKTGVTYVAQAGLELLTLLVQPPDCWDYRCVPICLDFCYAI